MHLTLYITILLVSLPLTWLYNVKFVETAYSSAQLFAYTYTCALAIMLADAAVATIIHKMPGKWFSPYLPQYKPIRGEKKFYKMINLAGWKDYIPETGKITTGLSKSEIASTEVEYLYHFLVETCYAETIHIWMALAGVIGIYVLPETLFYTLLLPEYIINFVLNVPPILIQRSNRPKLLYIYEIQKRRLETAQA